MKTSTLITSLSLCYTIWGTKARGAEGSRSLQSDDDYDLMPGTRLLAHDDGTDDPSRKLRSLVADDDYDGVPRDDKVNDPSHKLRSLEADDDFEPGRPPNAVESSPISSDPQSRRHLRTRHRVAK